MTPPAVTDRFRPTDAALGWRPSTSAPALAANDAAGAAQSTGVRRTLWLGLGSACLAIGTIGIVVPLLPTVDFYALAAICFGRADGRLERWLLAHPRLGPAILAWRERRGIPRRARWLASVSLAASAAIGWMALPASTAWIPPLACGLVAAWLWTRRSA